MEMTGLDLNTPSCFSSTTMWDYWKYVIYKHLNSHVTQRRLEDSVRFFHLWALALKKWRFVLQGRPHRSWLAVEGCSTLLTAPLHPENAQLLHCAAFAYTDLKDRMVPAMKQESTIFININKMKKHDLTVFGSWAWGSWLVLTTVLDCCLYFRHRTFYFFMYIFCRVFFRLIKTIGKATLPSYGRVQFHSHRSLIHG